MAIDAIVGILELFDPLGHFALQGDNILTGKREKWKNSKYDIVFGDSTNFIIGLGRQTIVAGPDIKSILDWTVLFDWLGEKIENKAGKFLYDFTFGQGGSTDFILGNKNLFNYGTADFSVTRKKYPTTEVKLVDDKKDKTYGGPTGWQKFLVAVYAAFQFGTAVAIRLLYMGLGINVDNEGETEKRKKLVEIFILVQSLVGIRILALLGKVETLYFTASEIEKRKEEATRHTGNLQRSLQESLNKKIKDLNPVANDNRMAGRNSIDLNENGRLEELNNGNVRRLSVSAERAIDGIKFGIDGKREIQEEIEVSAFAKTFVHQKNVNWHCGEGFNFISNPTIYGTDAKASKYDTEYSQKPDGFEFLLYDGNKANPKLQLVRLSREGLFLENEEPKSIHLSNGTSDSADRSRLNLTKGAVTLNCGLDSGGPSLDLNAKDKTLSISQSLRPTTVKGNLTFVNAPTVFLGENHAGLYGGKRTPTKNTAGYIELKGTKSVVIKLLGNEIKMDADGITIKSTGKITLDGTEGIDLKSGNNSLISVTPNDVTCQAFENKIMLKTDAIEQDAVLLKQYIKATMDKIATLEKSNIPGVSENKIGMELNGN